MSEEINVTVKNVKEFASPDGGGFNCTVYLNGKRFCSAHDGGHGGCISYDFLSSYKEGDKHPQVEIRRLDEVMKADPKKYAYEYSGMELFKDFDCLVNEAINAHYKEKEKRKFENQMKKRVLYRKADSKHGEYYKTAEHKTADQIKNTKEYLKQKYPDITFLDEGDNLKKFLAPKPKPQP
ncbi:MAG: hypothetical protein V3V74_07360 [Nitrosomonadaceae bacterium]